MDPYLYGYKHADGFSDLYPDLYGYTDLHLDANVYVPTNIYEYLNIYTDLFNHAYPDGIGDSDI